jgi:hypothetical protein
MRGLGASVSEREVQTRLAGLRVKLEKNLSLLDFHLKAVKEIAAIVARAIEEDESDGTYSALYTRGRGR